jgi:hypothetical protein
MDAWRKGWDSNPRGSVNPLAVFKTAALNRSATLPIAMFSITYFCRLRWRLRLLPCCYRAPLVRSFSAAEIIASTWRAAPSCIQTERGRRDRAPRGSLASWPRPLREGGRHIRICGCPAPGCRPPSIAATDQSAAATQRPAHVEPNCRSRRPRINAGSSVAMAPQIRISGPRPERRLITPSVRADAYGWSCCSACRC